MIVIHIHYYSGIFAVPAPDVAFALLNHRVAVSKLIYFAVEYYPVFYPFRKLYLKS